MLEKLSYEEYFTMWSSHIAKVDDDSHTWMKIEHNLIHPPDIKGNHVTFYCPTHCYVQAGKTVSIPTGYKIDGKPYAYEYKAKKNTCLSPGDILGTVEVNGEL